MGWRDWPYWLKGGIIVEAVHIIFIIIFVSIAVIKDSMATAGDWGAGFAGGIMLMFGLIMLIPMFIMGAIIGMVYGRQKKNPSSTKKIILIVLIILLIVIYLFPIIVGI